MSWKLMRGPREFRSTSLGHDMDIGWRYDVEKDGYGKSISVIVAGGRLGSPSLPDECNRAIQTKGRSAVDAVLTREHPPEIILVTTAGLREQPPPARRSAGRGEDRHVRPVRTHPSRAK